MTEVAFHFNVSDKLSYGCRLLRKAYAGGAKVAVVGDAALLAELDQMLWTFAPTEFLPHCRHGASPETVEASAVLLTESARDCVGRQVLVNLGSAVPEAFERFTRFIEIVTCADDDRAAARQRWKYYADRGYALKLHDLAAPGGQP